MRRRMITTTTTTARTTTKATTSSHRSVAECLVACNIYISAGTGGGGGGGGGHHSNKGTSAFLLNLLKDAQAECSRLRGGPRFVETKRNSTVSSLSSASLGAAAASKSKDNATVLPPLTVVHAYSDGPYNRSSFHLAGTAPLVTQLATKIAIQAIQQLSELLHRQHQQESTNDDNSSNSNSNSHRSQNTPPATDTAHPTVGLLDHISILPLFYQPSRPADSPPQPEDQEEEEDGGYPLMSREEWMHACSMMTTTTTTTMTTMKDPESPILVPFLCSDQLLPSASPKNDNDPLSSSSSSTTTTSPLVLSIPGWVARTIGHGLNQATTTTTTNRSCHILYYGQADPPTYHSLAHVRKHATQFFVRTPPTTSTTHHGNPNDDGTNHFTTATTTTIVGAPDSFVENYNVQIAVDTTGTNGRNHNKKNNKTKPIAIAQSLTKHIRSKEGYGLPHVEALTLPYGSWIKTNTAWERHHHEDDDNHHDGENADDQINDCAQPPAAAAAAPIRATIPMYEVACNLLNPRITSATDIDRRVQEWLLLMQQQQQEQEQDGSSHGCNSENDNAFGHAVTIVRSYRVGTTVDMCLQALEKTSTLQGEAEHNAKVLTEFESFLYNDAIHED